MEFLPSPFQLNNTALTRWTSGLAQHTVLMQHSNFSSYYNTIKNLKGYGDHFCTVLPFSVSQHAKPVFSLSVTQNSSINTLFQMLQTQLCVTCL